MKYLKTYNEQTQYITDILRLRSSLDDKSEEYISKIENCILYLSDLCKDHEIMLPDWESQKPIFHINFEFNRGNMYINEELVDNIERIIDRIKSEINGDTFKVAIELNTKTETTYHDYYDTPQGTNTIKDILKLNSLKQFIGGEITLIAISFK